VVSAPAWCSEMVPGSNHCVICHHGGFPPVLAATAGNSPSSGLARRMDVRYIHVVYVRIMRSAIYCGHDNHYSYFVKGGEFLGELSNCQLI
jgi:hypothetical protein